MAKKIVKDGSGERLLADSRPSDERARDLRKKLLGV